MPIAQNPDTGEVLFLDGDQWKPAQRAINPKTREMMAYDGKDWVHVDDAAAKSVGQQIVKDKTVPVKNQSTIDYLKQTAQNVPQSAENVAIGLGQSAYGAAKALVNPDPEAKLDFIKTQAESIVDHLKQYYKNGFAKQFEKDPVGVIADAFALFSGIRGGMARGLPVGETSEAARVSAARSVKEALDTDNATHKQIASTAQTLGSNPPETQPLDTGGTAVLSQVERLGQTSTAGREVMEPFLTARQEGSLTRISNDLAKLTGTTRTALQAKKQVMAERQAAADPAYKAAYEAGDRPIDTQELGRLSNVPEVQRAMRIAVSGWKRSQVAQGYGALEPGHLVERGGILKFLNNTVPVFPNIQFWDYTKAAIDKMIDAETRPDGSMTRKGRDLTIINKSLVQQLDQQVPEYAAARQAWAGPSQYIKSQELGADILKRGESAEEMEAEFNALTETNKQSYREAAVSAILNKLESNPSAEGLADLTRDLKSPAMKRKILALMPTQAAKDAWLKRLNFEVKSSQLVAAGLKGSQTARRLAQAQTEEAALDDIVLQTLRAAKDPKLHVVKLIADGYRSIKEKLHAERDREMAKILTGQKKPVSLRQAAKGTTTEQAVKKHPLNTSLLPTLGSSLFTTPQKQQ